MNGQFPARAFVAKVQHLLFYKEGRMNSHTAAVSAQEPSEAVKKAQIESLLNFFWDYNEKADRASDVRQWMIESAYRKSATDAAQTIFELLGFTNGQNKDGRTIGDSRRSRSADGAGEEHHLRGSVRNAQIETRGVSSNPDCTQNNSLCAVGCSTVDCSPIR